MEPVQGEARRVVGCGGGPDVNSGQQTMSVF